MSLFADLDALLSDPATPPVVAAPPVTPVPVPVPTPDVYTPEVSPLAALLPEIRRLSMIGLDVVTIAHRLGFNVRALEAHAVREPAIRDALLGGKAEGVDRIATTVFNAAEQGDMTAAKMMMARLAGWGAKAGVTVNLNNSGDAQASISLDNTDALLSGHSKLLEDFARIEGPKPE